MIAAFAWILGSLIIWLAVATPPAVLIGRAVRLADARDSRPLATVTDIADHRPVAS